MSWILTGAACVAFASSAVTLAMVAETEPYINEEGEEEYTLSGYLLLAGAYMIKWGIRKIVRLFKGSANNHQSVDAHQPKFEVDRETNDHELII